MSSAELLLYLVLVPAAIVAVIWVLAYSGGSRSPRRYRPGRQYEFAPVWYVAKRPDRPGSDRPAIAAGRTGGGQPDEAAAAAVAGSKGGASDRW